MRKQAGTAFLMLIFGLTAAWGCGGGSIDGSAQDVRYTAVGASDAAGVGAVPPSKGYVFGIQDGLQSEIGKEVQLINLGIPGAGASEMKTYVLPLAVQSQPDVVTVWAGGNDLVAGRSAAEFGEDLEHIFSRLRNETGSLIVAANLPAMHLLPRFQADPSPDVNEARVAAYNQKISELAQRYGVALVDIHAMDVQEVFLSIDGFHPSTSGHHEIAELFLEVIVPALNGDL